MRKRRMKVENMYLLKKKQADRRRWERTLRLPWKAILSIACRCGIVLGFIAFIGIWAGAESGALLIGRRLLWTVADGILVFWLLRKEGGR